MNAVKKGLSIVRHIESLYGTHSSIFSVTLQLSSWVPSVHVSVTLDKSKLSGWANALAPKKD